LNLEYVGDLDGRKSLTGYIFNHQLEGFFTVFNYIICHGGRIYGIDVSSYGRYLVKRVIVLLMMLGFIRRKL